MNEELKNYYEQVEVDEKLKSDVNLRIQRHNQLKQERLAHRHRLQKKYKKPMIFAAVIMAVILIIPAFATISNALYNPSYDFSKARAVKTEKRLAEVLSLETKSGSYFSEVLGFNAPKGNMDASTVVPPPMSAEFGDEAPRETAPQENHSTTNVQVDGMDEGDLVKTDGQYIYRLSTGGFSITQANKGQLSYVCQIDIENFNPIEMFVADNLLVLVGGSYKAMPYYDEYNLASGGYMECFYYHSSVQIRVYDLGDIQNPVQKLFYEIEGNYQTSRISEKDNTMYFVVNYYNYNYYNYYDYKNAEQKADIAKQKRPYVKTSLDSEPQPFDIDDIYYFRNVPSSNYLVLGSIELDSLDGGVQAKAYLSSGGTIYVSGDYLYNSVSQWFYSSFSGQSSQNVSYISKFSLKELEFEASGKIKGAVKDRHCLDEYEGYLRVATSYFDSSGTANGIYVFDDNMKQVSKILGIAEGEAIDSASFSGNKGYISTSVRMIDPLFIIDFTDIKKPTISTGLKEDGINMYLKTISGSDFVLGLGMDASSIKLQLYDMSGQEAVSVEKLTIDGNCSYAEALYNPKAVLYMYDEDTKKGYFGFAAERAGYDYSSHSYEYNIFEQGFYLYQFDAQSGTLEFVGLLSNFDTSKPLNQFGNEYDFESYYNLYLQYVYRAVIIGDYVYTISNSVISSYSLQDFSFVARI